MQQIADVTVIICAYTEQRWDDLIAAVASIKRQLMAPREIIVVIDENSSLLARATVQFAGVQFAGVQFAGVQFAGAQCVGVQVIPNKEARGLSGARNSGIAVAQGAIIAFMDEDAIAEPTWLENLVAAYRDERVIGVGGAIVPQWAQVRPAWFPSEFHWVVGCTYRGMPTTTAPVRNLIGCNMSFRRELFTAVGGFRHGMGRIGTKPLGCEETELCIRALQYWPDRCLCYEPSARVHHYVPATRATWAYFVARCYAEGLSKAQVTNLVGTNDGLASEWTYTLQTLPQAVLRGLLDPLTRYDLDGLGRATAIVLGLGMTTLGYLRGRLAGWFTTQPGLSTQPQFALKELS